MLIPLEPKEEGVVVGEGVDEIIINKDTYTI
jgi:hypothetical protein